MKGKEDYYRLLSIILGYYCLLLLYITVDSTQSVASNLSSFSVFSSSCKISVIFIGLLKHLNFLTKCS